MLASDNGHWSPRLWAEKCVFSRIFAGSLVSADRIAGDLCGDRGGLGNESFRRRFDSTRVFVFVS